MSVKRWGLLAPVGLFCAFAASCALDEREVSLTFPLLGDGGGVVDGVGPGSTLSAPALEVVPSMVDLGWVTTGFPSRARVTVSNTGNALLPRPNVSWVPGNDPEIEVIQNQCLEDLAPGASCELRVQLVTSRAVALQGTLHVQSTAGGAGDVAFSGLGLPAGDLILTPAVGSFEDFGGSRIGAALEGVFNLNNPSPVSSGPLTFNINRPEFSLLPPNGAEDCVPGTTALVNGQSCTVRVAFAAAERGPVEATLTSSSAAVGSVSLTLSGQGLAPAALAASSPMLDFGGVLLGQGAQRAVAFENAGDEPLQLAGASLREAVEGFVILTSDCGEGAVLASGQTCNVLIEFRPPLTNQEVTAELVIADASGLLTQTVALRGIGLDEGALSITPLTEGSDDFGDVLVGQSRETILRVANDTPQPSGLLELVVSEGFELVAPPVDGDCVTGSTSLVNGESCTARVRFTPIERRPVGGSLTVTSALTGAATLPLVARGILPASLAAATEVNFGRVLTGASGVRPLTVRNDGDEPLLPPVLELSGSVAEQVAAFSHVSQCTAPLAFGEQCTIQLSFAPTIAAAHSANLVATSTPGGTLTVLLLGEAQQPGSLVVAPAAGSSADFGDVAINAPATQTFTLTNPGNVASGELAITTDDNRFQAQLGDCNQGDPAGLVDGASCSFSVQFVPDDSLPLVANLSVQSPGAGRAGLQLTGRGRVPATLSATASRDLGRANVGQTDPLNDFSWTVNNAGDLPTGALTVENLSGGATGQPEFEIRDDTCSAAAVAGRSSCQMTISFRPSTTGARSGRIVVTDPVGGSSAPLDLTGLGVQVAGPGESCVNAECSVGVCTRGVCCDRACDRTCQICSSAGVCLDQSSREACGTGGAACFGVDSCKLPEGAGCSAVGGDDQCGSGNCEQRLGGAGGGDRVCCLDDCLPGQQCNAQNRCQDPALAAGAACGAPGALPCGAGLACKACRGGGSQCTAPDDCCGDCDVGLVCSAGSCQCPVASNGRPGIPCGGGLCAIDREGACCPGAPPPGCNCDSRDNLCKECLVPEDCPVGGSGTRRECNANTCSTPCDTPAFKACDGACIGAGECCGGCGAGLTCVNAQCLPEIGQACTGACAEGTCAPAVGGGSRCCSTPCGAGELCDAAGACAVQGIPPEGTCVEGERCQEGECILTYIDADGDGFAPAGAVGVGSCTRVPDGRTALDPTIDGSSDCCDASILFQPNQTVGSNTPVAGCVGLDRNCSDAEESTTFIQNREQDCGDTSIAVCSNRGGYVVRSSCGDLTGADAVGPPIPECGAPGCIGPCGEDGAGGCVPRPGGISVRGPCL